MSNVKPGQVWADCDPRAGSRTLRVESIGGDVMRPSAVCTVLTDAAGTRQTSVGRRVLISVDRFKPGSRGYRLIEEQK